ncbi:MAG: glutamyl-tRNA reductase [Bacteroidota bacterium]|nr:glutamyl-tRNA reductase [Bacteroidota bacterium]
MIGLVGINHKTALVDIREKFSFNEEEIKKFCLLLQIDVFLRGCVILSTCNRMEIYFHTENHNVKTGFDFILRNLAYFKGYTEDFRQNFYFKHDEGAVNHLFKVACGLDSLVIGEDQIISQVKNAFCLCQSINAVDNLLSRMFQKAIEAGKRVRTETAINKGCASVSSAAIELVESITGNLSKKAVLFIGAGQSGELAIQSFLKKGGKTLYISNRTLEKAEELAKLYNAKTVKFEEKNAFLMHADVVITATSASTSIISYYDVESAMNHRKGKQQIYIDLSVPRNISEDISKLDNVRLFGLDNLLDIVNSNLEKRKDAVEQATLILNDIIYEFHAWLTSRSLLPTIKKIKSFHNFNEKEFETFAKANSVKDIALYHQFVSHLSEKITRKLIKNLKNVTDNGRNTDYINLIDRLFESSSDE